jgi:putative ABC transport system substrate-binding protein
MHTASPQHSPPDCRITMRRLACMLLLVLPGLAPAQDTSVVLLSSSRSGLYSDFVTAFSAQLQTRPDIQLGIAYLDDDATATSRQVANAALLVTVGTRAAQYADANDRPAVLNTLIPGSSFHALAEQQACVSHTAIFIDQPVRRQALLAHTLFPEAHHYGILLGPTSVQRKTEIEAMKLPGDLHVETEEISEEPGAALESRRLLKQSDLLLAINDPLVLIGENAKWLLYNAYQLQLPVIGFSQAYVRAGAAAAVFSEPAQLARQAAELVTQWIDNGQHCLPGPRYPSYFSVSVNRAVAGSLGAKINSDDELLRIIQSGEQAP